MILAIDIGNTNIMLGGFLADELSVVVGISTDPAQTVDEYASKILSVLSLHGVARDAIRGAIISSVVPPLTAVMKKAVSFLDTLCVTIIIDIKIIATIISFSNIFHIVLMIFITILTSLLLFVTYIFQFFL